MTHTLDTSASLREVVLHTLGRIAPEADLTTLDPTEDLREQLDLDSVDFLNFVTGLHDEVKVEIPEADYAKVRTLEGCIAYLSAA